MQVNRFLPLFDKILLLHLTPPYAGRRLFCPDSLSNYAQPVLFSFFFFLDYTCEEEREREKNDQKVYAHCINYAHVFTHRLE